MGYKVYTLGDVSEKISYGYTISASLEEVGPKFLRITDIREDFINWKSVPYCEINEKSYEKNRLEYGDIVIARTGATTGINAVIDKDGEGAVFASYLIRYKIDKSLANPFYIAYLLKTYEWEGYVNGIIGGSAQPGANARQFGKFKFELPSLEVQGKVVSTLDFIQNKIKLNMKNISNLEQLAQTLFKHWFVDFEFPNENGEPYKSSDGEMMESELGMIPSSWKLVELNQIITHSKKTFNPKKTESNEVAHFSLPAFDRQEYPLIETSESIKSNKYFIDKNSLMFSKMNPTTPRIWLPNILKDIENVCSSEFVVLDTSLNNNKAFIYSLIKSESFTSFLIKNASGSTNSRQRVIPTNAISYLFPYNKDISLVFNDFVQSFYDKILVLREENQSLFSLRDTLLPKLLSGEIELPDETEVTEDVPIP